MRTGAIFARGSCRALKWMALFGVVFMLGAGQAAAQEPAADGPLSHAVVDDVAARTAVVAVLQGTVTIGAAATDPAGEMLSSTFSMAGYTVSEDTQPAITQGAGSLAGYSLVTVTFTGRISEGAAVPLLVYTPPDAAIDARLQLGGTRDLLGFSFLVRRATPQLPLIVEDMSVEIGELVNEQLPEVLGGGMLPIVYTLDDGDTTNTAAGDNIATDTLDSGLRFDDATRTIVGYPKDAGEYEVTYTAASADGTALNDVRTFTIAVVTEGPIQRGIITAVAVDDAVDKTIGGVTRAHIDEGELTTASVTVEWNHQEVTRLWAGHTTASPPEPATVQIRVEHDTDTDSREWISPAETNENPGDGALGGDDAVLATNTVSIAIPAKPKATEYPNDTSRFRSSTGKVSLSLPLDQDAENEGFRVHVVPRSGVNVSTSAPRGMTMTDRMIVIEDVHVQKVALSRDPASTSAIFEGGSVTFKAVASPAREDLDLQVRYDVTTLDGVSVSSRLYTLDSSIGTIPVGTGPAAKDQVKFTSPKNDGDREDNELTIHAEVVSFDLTSGAFDDIDTSTVDFTVLDLHKLPPLDRVTPMEGTVKEGESIMLELVVDRNPATTRRVGGEKVDVTKEALTVMLSMGAGSTASASDYQIMTNPVSIPEYKTGATEQKVMVEVMAVADNDVDDMEMLVLDAEVNGTVAASGPNTDDDSYAGVSMLTIEEGTTKLVSPKTDEEIQAVIYPAKEAGMGADMMFNPGEMIVVAPASSLFNAAQGVTLSYSAMSDNEDVATVMVSGSTVTVTAQDMAGVMAHITITAHASMAAGAKGLPQTDRSEASIIFPVEVGLEALSFTLMGPEDMNVAEGMSAMVTATASRAVTADVTINLMRDRAASTAGDDDYMAEAITIEAGMMSGTTMVMAVEDNMAEEMEELVLYGMAADNAGEVTGEVKLYLWDATVPALPIIAQLLLGLFLAMGGYRRYLRR